VPQNFDEAEKWYRMAAEHGLAEARRNLEILAARREAVPPGGVDASAQTSAGYAGHGQGFVSDQRPR
jgi:TPR repeat protein